MATAKSLDIFRVLNRVVHHYNPAHYPLDYGGPIVSPDYVPRSPKQVHKVCLYNFTT